MGNFRYTLNDKETLGKRKVFECPSCGKKTFSCYVDTWAKEYLHSTVGKCSRLTNCGHHYPPRKYFDDNKHLSNSNVKRPLVKPITRTLPPVSYVSQGIFKSSLSHYEQNN